MNGIAAQLLRYLNDGKKYRAQYYQVDVRFLERILAKMQDDEEVIKLLRGHIELLRLRVDIIGKN